MSAPGVAIANFSTKVVLGVDQTEVKRVAKHFRFAEGLVSQLLPLEARCGIEYNINVL